MGRKRSQEVYYGQGARAFQTGGYNLAGLSLEVSLSQWHGVEDGFGAELTTVDVSHWNADQFRRFWEFVHAN